MTHSRYKVTIIEFSGEDDSLKAQALYEQTVLSLDLRKVIEAVNDTPPEIEFIKRRATRSDKGKPKKAPPVATE